MSSFTNSTILSPQHKIVETNWIAITGGPCSGKSLLFEHLNRAEQHTVPEFAEELIKNELASGGNVQELKKDHTRFADKIAEHSRSVIQSSDIKSVIFFNTTLIDHAVYNRVYGRPQYEDLENLAFKYKFQKVFFLENNPQYYQQSAERTEDYEQAEIIAKSMLTAYQLLGYEVERLAFTENFHDRIAEIFTKVKFHI
jgi:predicted ATPase